MSDFLVIGDIRDLSIEGWKYVKGEEVDEILVALSTIGVVATGTQVASAVGSVGTAGAATPTVAASTTAKTSIVMLKTARKLGKLPKWLLKGIKEAAIAVKESKSIAKLTDLFDDVYKLAKTKGGLEILSKTTDAASLKKMANFADKFGDNSLMMIKLGGEKVLRAGEKIQDAHVIKQATAYGENGVALLNRVGANKFMKIMKIMPKKGLAKIGWKHRLALPNLLNKLLPTWALYVLAFSGIAIWLPMKRWTLAALRKLAGKIPFLRNRLETGDADAA